MFWNKYWKRAAKYYKDLSDMRRYALVGWKKLLEEEQIRARNRAEKLQIDLTKSEQRVKDLEDIKTDLEAELDNLHYRLYGSGSF